MNKSILAFAVGCMLSSVSFAANVALDDASDTAYSGGWTNGSNGGSGFAAWLFGFTSPGNPSVNGNFIGSSTGNGDGADNGTIGGLPADGDINSAGAAWGLYANSTNNVEAIRGLTGGSLAVGQTITASLDNGFLNTGSTVGLSLRNALNQNIWEVFFTGGNPSYTINDGAGFTGSTVGFTDEGLDITFTLVSASTYNAIIARQDGVNQVILGGSLITPGSGAQAIDEIRYFNANAGSGGNFDAFGNSLAVVPEPATLALSGLGLLGLLIARRRKA